MIKPLRKYHYWTWRLIAFGLPMLFVLAIWLRPYQNISQFSEDDNIEFKSETIDSVLLITIKINYPLPVASCAVYANKDNDKIFLGFMKPNGNSFFQAPVITHSVSVFDVVRNTEIKEFKTETQ